MRLQMEDEGSASMPALPASVACLRTNSLPPMDMLRQLQQPPAADGQSDSERSYETTHSWLDQKTEPHALGVLLSRPLPIRLCVYCLNYDSGGHPTCVKTRNHQTAHTMHAGNASVLFCGAILCCRKTSQGHS